MISSIHDSAVRKLLVKQSYEHKIPLLDQVIVSQYLVT